MNFSLRIDNKQRAFADTILVAVHAVPARHVTLRFKVRQKGEMKLAVACERGMYLAGAITLPEYRGRGCYRALLRARWDEAVRLGAPALVVHAQETSRPILERCGFERVATLHELASGPR